MRRVLRSEIKTAEYNPRSLSEYARKRLAESLERFGLVETLVWNEKTGVLVSGHQRLSILDEQYGYPFCVRVCPGNDYSVDVSVVSLSVKREKELNVWLNNRAAQGTFDKDLFAALLKDEPDLKLDDLGMTSVDLDFEFGDTGVFDQIFVRENDAATSITKSAEAIAEHRKEVREKRTAEEHRQDGAPEADGDYYLMLVFPSRNDKEQWLKVNRFPVNSRFISHAEYEAAISAK